MKFSKVLTRYDAAETAAAKKHGFKKATTLPPGWVPKDFGNGKLDSLRDFNPSVLEKPCPKCHKKGGLRPRWEYLIIQEQPVKSGFVAGVRCLKCGTFSKQVVTDEYKLIPVE